MKKYNKNLFLILFCLSFMNFNSTNPFDREGEEMSIIKWRPFFDDLEESFYRPMREQAFDLAIDVYEENNNVISKMHVPGIKPEDLEIYIDDKNNLHIAGERKEEKETKEKDYYHKEIKHGSFHRVVSLPSEVDEDQITATVSDDGVLFVTMPKIQEEQKQVKKIKVQRQ